MSKIMNRHWTAYAFPRIQQNVISISSDGGWNIFLVELLKGKGDKAVVFGVIKTKIRHLVTQKSPAGAAVALAYMSWWPSIFLLYDTVRYQRRLYEYIIGAEKCSKSLCPMYSYSQGIGLYICRHRVPPVLLDEGRYDILSKAKSEFIVHESFDAMPNVFNV